MPRISVVVPIYNVDRYLSACLESVAGQSVSDLEVVMVDDGSTDRSAAIAREFTGRDDRFTLLTQPNGGLSRARNTGIDAASGELLAFLDSDDVLPRNAYELLLRALDESGSEFASGNVHRLTGWGTTSQARFLAETFARTRLGTHVTEFRPLLADRTAWNKLWRRSFWDEHAFRFPEGVVHEDIPIVLPAHFMARSVDVISEPVYLYRMREDGELSITQRRLEPRVLLDRVAAIEQVSAFLAEQGPRDAQRWYHESVVADDLRYHLNILDRGDEEYRELFLERVNAFLDTADPDIYDPLPAIERLKWHLVRQRSMPELLEVFRFEREELATKPPVRDGKRWYGDYPFRTDSRLRIPPSVYQLDSELQLDAQLEELWREGDKLRLRGYAYVTGIGAPDRSTQRLQLTALRPGRSGRLRRLRLRAAAKRLKTTTTHRPDVTAKVNQSMCDLSWAGFEATLDPRDLRAAGRRGEGTWELYASVEAAGVKRRARLFVETPGALRAVDLTVSEDIDVKAASTWTGKAVVEVRKQWLEVQDHRLGPGDVLELSGDVRLPARATPKLELSGDGGERIHRYPLDIDGGRFAARVPLPELRVEAGPGGSDPDDETVWTLTAVEGERRVAIGLPEALAGTAWRSGAREAAIVRRRRGNASLALRRVRAVVTKARWDADGVLAVSGELPPDIALDALLLLDENRGQQHTFAVERDGATGRFQALLTPARLASLGGGVPLDVGTWQLCSRGAGEAAAITPVMLIVPGESSLTTVVDHKPFILRTARDGRAVVIVQRNHDDDERGPYHQRRLARSAYAGRRARPLRDAVVYSSYGGRQYSDSPRAIHEELVGRGSPLEHLWVVRDGTCRPPEGATVLREGSREYYEALADARFVVTNDHFPTWFARREDQVCVQTWHGTPLKRLGLDVSEARKTVRRFEHRWAEQTANWQYVVSPNRFSTPILRRAYAVEGEMLETGYPRVDVLARAARDDTPRRRLRHRLGLPDDVRVVLYAPTYRDHLRDGRGRYRLDLRLDVERLRAAVGDDTVILFRKHHYVTDAVPVTADGFVRDVSSYPDGTELLLAADVLVTDYSSMMVDFANTGRPMLFFTYDLDAYEDEIRGFYLDFVNAVPGPLLRSSDEVADALRDLGAVERAYAERYAAFRSTFCELDDGAAAARVVDRVFSC